MTKLMFLQASPRSTESKSIEIAQVYLDTLCAKNPDLVVDRLDLWEADLPVFDGDKAAAKLNVILGNDQNFHPADSLGSNRRHCQSLHFRRSLPFRCPDVEWWRSLPPKAIHRHHTPTPSPLRPEAGNRLFWAAGEQARDTRFNIWSICLELPVAGIRGGSSFDLSARLVEPGGHISDRRTALPADAADGRPGR